MLMQDAVQVYFQQPIGFYRYFSFGVNMSKFHQNPIFYILLKKLQNNLSTYGFTELTWLLFVNCCKYNTREQRMSAIL